MQLESDARLLRDYAENGAESAFAEIVQRHTNLVYSAALRQAEFPDIAAEITQSAFVGLARGASSLLPKLAAEASLAGWLCRSARNLALNHRRDDFRRRTRERHAMEQLLSTPNDAPSWEHLRRVLDDAMAELTDADYDAVVLRFFQDQDFRAVGAALGVSDDTAQKRVSRALETLRDLLTQRGIRTTAGALGIAITANAVQAAPVGLAVTVSTAALATITATTSTLIAATTKTVAMTTLQKTLVTATVAVLAGVGIYEARQAAQLRDQVQTLQQQQAPLAEQIQQLQNERGDATNRLADLLAENTQLKSGQEKKELLKLRGEVGLLRQKASDLAQLIKNLQDAGKQDSPTFPTNFVSVRSMQFAGHDTPAATLESAMWAKSIGNEKAWLECLFPDVAEVVSNEYVQGTTAAERSQFLINQCKNFTQARIVNQIPLADDAVLAQVEIEFQVSGVTNRLNSMEVLKKVDGEWKYFDEFNQNSLTPAKGR